MAEDIRISELSNVSSLGNNDLIEVSQVNAQSETGYDSKKATLINVGDRVCNGIEYANALYTSNKKIIGAINEIASYTPVYNNTASGAIATFDTSLALPLQDLQIAINAVQESGTPTPSSPKLISGFTGANIKGLGKNLINITDCLNDYYVKSSDLSVSSIAGANVFYCDVPKNTDLVLTPDKSNRCVILGYKTRPSTIAGSVGDELIVDSPSGITSRSFNTGNNQFLAIYVNRDSANKPTQIMLEVGTVASAYQAYNSNTSAISWQSESGTVYGGSLDVTSGVLTVTCVGVLIDGVTVKATSGDLYSGRLRASVPYPSGKTVHYEGASTYCLCDKIKPNYNATIGSQVGSDVLAIFPHSSGIFIKFSDDCNVSDVASANAWLSNNNVFIVYELSTPVTYQLTTTQMSAIVGTNNIFTDTNGNTSVVYACSLKDYIDSQ